MNAIDTLAAAIGRPPAKQLEELYTPDELPAVREEIEHLEAELDAQWPGWRAKKPFTTQPVPVVRFVKERLRRRSLLLQGLKDWGVVLTETKTKAGTQVYAHAVPPPRGRMVGVALEAYQLPASATVLAVALGVELADVEHAIATARATGQRPTRRWLRGQLRGGVA